MKSSATVTWFRGNYGSALQAFALQKTLQNLNVENEIVNYIPNRKEKIKFFLVGTARTVILKKKIDTYIISKKYLSAEELNKKRKCFENFYNCYISTTCRYSDQNSLRELSNKYDYYICGSDQIWNPAYYKKYQFLHFVDDGEIKIAYAPSVGTSSLSNKEKNKIIPLIRKFNAISLREEEGRKLLQPLVNKPISVVCDPVFLLPPKQWIRQFGIGDKNEEKYILCYFLGRNDKNYKSAEKIASLLNMKLKVIPTSYLDYKVNGKIEKEVGPIEWLDLLLNAELILTDSFHATAFSLIFNKNFYTIKRFKDDSKKSQNSRLNHILKYVGLNDRMVENINIRSLDKIKISTQEWKRVNDIIENYRTESLNWLKNAIRVYK